jgi:hypothetical protein
LCEVNPLAKSNQFNARLPGITHQQINEVVQLHGLTKTQVIIVAVDRLARDLMERLPDASKDVRRIKTVARIAPHIDLGQDD